MSKRRSPEQWRALLESFDRSSQTQPAFCSDYGISISTLQYQLRRKRSGSGNRDSEPASTPRLLEVTPINDLKTLTGAHDRTSQGGSLRVELSLESRAFTVDCRPDQFGVLLDEFSIFHDQREARR